MKNFLLFLLSVPLFGTLKAQCSHSSVPFQRIRFHDRIKEAQQKCDLADGKADSLIKISGNDEINLQVTDALYRKIADIVCFIETDSSMPTNNDKIRQLSFVEEILTAYRLNWKAKKLNPAYAPVLIDNFEKILRANLAGESMASFIREAPYEVGLVTAAVFKDNKGYPDSKQILYIKYCALHPDNILATIRPYTTAPFADSLVVVACTNNPKQLYDYASSPSSPEAKLIRQNTNPMVKAVAKLGQTPNALLYYPFLDDIISGKQSIDSIKRYITEGPRGADSIGYYKLLVKTEVSYYERIIKKDTPIGMFGTNGLRDMLYKKALSNFITPINELHEQNNLAIRMKAIEPLTAEELYLMIVMGENDIYTSSYKHSFSRLLQLLGPKPRTDRLLMNVKMDFLKNL